MVDTNELGNVSGWKEYGKYRLLKPAESAHHLAIVAVLGLPDGMESDSPTEIATSWLNELLPRDLTTGCSISSFSWKPDRENAGFKGAAKCLQNEIRQNIGKPQYIFLAHSLGGIVAKEALANDVDIRKSTTGVLFFGTPHHKLPDSLMTTQNVKEILRKTYFQEVNEHFYHIAPQFRIVSFYETVPSRDLTPARVVVSAHNATLNLPNEVSIASPVEHQNLFKFNSVCDEGYDIVIASIRVMNPRISWPKLHRPERFGPKKGHSPRLNDESESEFDDEMFFYLVTKHGLVGEPRRSVAEFQVESPVAFALKVSSDPLDKADIKCSWAHIPANSTHWIHPCPQSISKEAGFDLEITSSRFWHSFERNSTALASHARFMFPSSHVISGKHHTLDTKWNQCAVYLPYLQWDSFNSFQKRAKELKEVMDNRGSGKRKVLNRLGTHMGPFFHARRSLDQYFYTALDDTIARDADQVVMKRSGHVLPPEDRKMIMVDQLWLWILDQDDCDTNHNVTPAILTSFEPRTPEESTDTLKWTADLYQDIKNEIGRLPSRYSNRYRLAELVIRRAVNVMLDVREDSLDFLGIFHQEIGKLADQQAQHYRAFQENLSRTPGQPPGTMNRRSEMECILLAADMMDELNMLKGVFETQRDTLISFHRKIGQSGTGKKSNPSKFAKALKSIAKEDVSGHLEHVDRLMKSVKRVHQAFLDLLDLQQREANLQELQNSNLELQKSNEQARMTQQQAKQASRQADETQRQSIVILLFTVVTVIFTPLSFFTSYYGMNVVSFTGESGNQSLTYVWTVMGPASVRIIIALFSAAYFLYLRAGWGFHHSRSESKPGSLKNVGQGKPQSDLERGHIEMRQLS